MARTKDFDEDVVLNKAVCLFWQKGYNATSMQDLVDNLGISRSSLYDTFGDKHDLYVKSLEHYQNENGGKIFDIINNTKSAKDAIRLLLEFIAGDLLSDKQRKGCFMVNAGVEVAQTDPAVMKIIHRNEELIEESFFNAIERGKKTSEINNKQDSRALSRFVCNTVKGIQVSSKSKKDKKFFEDIIETAMLVFA